MALLQVNKIYPYFLDESGASQGGSATTIIFQNLRLFQKFLKDGTNLYILHNLYYQHLIHKVLICLYPDIQHENQVQVLLSSYFPNFFICQVNSELLRSQFFKERKLNFAQTLISNMLRFLRILNPFFNSILFQTCFTGLS